MVGTVSMLKGSWVFPLLVYYVVYSALCDTLKLQLTRMAGCQAEGHADPTRRYTGDDVDGFAVLCGVASTMLGEISGQPYASVVLWRRLRLVTPCSWLDQIEKI